MLTCKRMKLDLDLTAYTIINLKWIKGLNVRIYCKTPRRKHRKNLFSTLVLAIFLGYDTRSTDSKSEIDKWGYIKPKYF